MTPPLRKAVFRLIAALLIALPPGSALAQSSTRILKYNEKGEVIGVETTQPKANEAAPGSARSTTDRSPDTGQPQVPGGDRIEEPPAEPGEIIVLDPPAGFVRAMRADGYAVIERISLQTLGLTVVRLRTPATVSAADAVRAVGARFPAVAVAVNQRFTLNGGRPGDYGRAVIGWGEVPAACGAGIRIGIIDTLVDPDHPAIKGQRIARRSFLPKGAKPGISDHGTAVAALLVGKPESGAWRGLLPGASLYAANIFAARADGGLRANLSSMMKALDWLAQKKVQVVNFSLAGSPNKILTKLMQRASDRGLALVAAAGNGGAEARPAYPAAHPVVLAVTAIDRRLAPYDFANQGDYIDFAAPGVELWTARAGGGGLQSGTSFASPFIAAAVALHLSNGVKPDSRTLRAQLRRFAKDLGPPGRDRVFGWGLVRIRPNC